LPDDIEPFSSRKPGLELGFFVPLQAIFDPQTIMRHHSPENEFCCALRPMLDGLTCNEMSGLYMRMQRPNHALKPAA